MNRRSPVLWFAVFMAGFLVNFGTNQLMRFAGLDDYASLAGITLGTLAVMIVYSADARWARGRGGGSGGIGHP